MSEDFSRSPRLAIRVSLSTHRFALSTLPLPLLACNRAFAATSCLSCCFCTSSACFCRSEHFARSCTLSCRVEQSGQL